MKLAGFSVRNSVLINLISFLIIVVGIFAMFHLRKEAFPQVDYDIMSITTYYPGAPAEDVEKLVTIPIEKEIKGISGIKDIDSVSEEGFSNIGITIDPKATDKEQVVDDVERAVDRVRNLPSGVKDDPYIFELKSKEIPVIEISISGPYSEQVRRQYAENLEDIVLNITGVASVRRFGWRDPQFHVEVNPVKIKEYHVSMNEIMTALKTRNITLPGGHLTTQTEEFNVRTTGEFNTAQEIENVIIRANDAGNWLRIKDIAQVLDTFEDEKSIGRVNGERALGLVVVKSEGGDITAVVTNVLESVEQFKKSIPDDMELETANDMSFYVKRRLGVLKMNGLIGFVLVLIILFLFLDPMPALMTAIGIPIALFTTFFAMMALGITVNLVSMLGLIIVLGMLVDDGIIVSENVYRYIEQGMPPKEAAVKGTNEVMAPVLATILTTFAFFAPLFFLPDIIGKFIREIPMVVILALSASLFEAFIILPSHLADFVRGKKYQNGHHEDRRKRGWFIKLSKIYERTLRGAIKHRYLVIAGLVVFSAVTIFCAIFVFKLKVIMFTGEGIEDFFIRAEAKQGTSLEQMEELLKPVEKMVEGLGDHELDSYRTYIGEITEEIGFDPNSKRGTNFGQVTVYLTPAQRRERRQKDIVEALRPQLEKIQGFEKLYFYAAKEGPPSGKAVEIGVKGDRLERLNEISQILAEHLKTIEGVSDVSTNYNFGKKELKVIVDEARAKKFYISITDVANAVRSTFYGGIATTVKPLKAEDEIEVVVRYEEDYRNKRNSFEDILVENAQGNLIPLKSVAQIVEKEGLHAITHYDGKRVVWVTADVDQEKATSFSVNSKMKKQFDNIEKDYLGYSLKFGGEYEEQKETQVNLLFSFVIALFICYIILTAIFKSLIQPFIVMTAIPFGILGVVIAFMLHGRPLSFFALMGSVGLAGIVVNDSVVLVDFINKSRKSGMGRRESLITSGLTRLRPVLMTTITTIGGLVSVAYGIGGGDPFLKPMGLSICWGLFFATGLTLLVIPCIYAIVDDIILKIFHHATVTADD
ncbi:efflux RND transporter permease subunit [Candidatus Omnitrophota bacterium]